MKFEGPDKFEEARMVIPGVIPDGALEEQSQEEAKKEKVIGYDNFSATSESRSETVAESTKESIDASDPEIRERIRTNAEEKQAQAKKVSFVFTEIIGSTDPDIQSLLSTGTSTATAVQSSYESLIAALDAFTEPVTEGEGVTEQRAYHLEQAEAEFSENYTKLLTLKDEVITEARRRLGKEIKDPLTNNREAVGKSIPGKDQEETDEEEAHEFMPGNHEVPEEEKSEITRAHQSALQKALDTDGDGGSMHAPGAFFENIGKDPSDSEEGVASEREKTQAKDELEKATNPIETHSYSFDEVVLQNETVEGVLQIVTIADVEIETFNITKQDSDAVKKSLITVLRALRDKGLLVSLHEAGALEAKVKTQLEVLYADTFGQSEDASIGAVSFGSVTFEQLEEDEDDQKDTDESESEVVQTDTRNSEQVENHIESSHHKPEPDTEAQPEVLVATPPPLLREAETEPEPANGFTTEGGPLSEVLEEVFISELQGHTRAIKQMIIERMTEIVAAHPENFGLSEDTTDEVPSGVVLDKAELTQLLAGVTKMVNR